MLIFYLSNFYKPIETMKLELKHLSPYIPYKLNFYVEHLNGERLDNWIMGIDTDLRQVLQFQNKPILNPLQNLKSMFKDDDQWIEEFKDYAGGDWCDIYDDAISHIEENFYTVINVMALPYQLMEWLISLHFDVFCLIPEGLAIDINTL